ncbi:MAG: signal peptidase I, partial [Deltaproteobacteria bacterium]
ETKLARSWGTIRRGDIIVFRFPGDRSKDYIKRAVGLPGDRVELRDKVLYVNDRMADGAYAVYKGGVLGEETRGNSSFGPYTVPEGMVFAMGDNRDRSYDSRYWGPVPVHDIKGKALVIYWSWDREDRWVRFGRIGKLLH